MKLLKSKSIQIFITLILISLTLTGSECDNITDEDQSTPQDLYGEWRLTSQTGALQDICPEEIVSFQTSMSAQLTCPGATPINRSFEVVDEILTYTETSISYDLDIMENGTKLSLKGRNVSRNLFYDKNIATSIQPEIKDNVNSNNSSEVKK